mgnify:CR=1 FL=1
MKKLLSVFAAAAMLFGFASCSGDLHDYEYNETCIGLYLAGDIQADADNRGKLKYVDETTQTYEFKYNLPQGYELMTAEEYYGEKNEEEGWVYIVDKNNAYTDAESDEEFFDIIAVIEPAWAKDANGKSVNTSYKVRNNVLVQTVYFNKDSSFPIVADPTTSTKPDNYKIETVYSDSFKLNNATLGLPGLGASAATALLTKKAKEKATTLITAKLGSKLIPVLNFVLLGLSGYCTYQGYKGYTYTKVSLSCEKWAIYKHQGGKWVKGIGYKGKLSFKGSN